ncbi:MAG: hypothetical protein ACHQT9_04530 [Candidatus Saccharimonadales bacterium]
MILGLLQYFSLAPSICEKNTFFIFRPWFHYIQTSDFKGCTVQNFNLLPGGGNSSDIPLVLLAIVDDLLRLAGLIAIGFVIYGAIQYVVSQGEPEKTGKAKNTITDALVGLVISISAVAVVSFIGSKVGGS